MDFFLMYVILIKQIMGGNQSAISEQDLQQVESSHPMFKKIRVLVSQEGKTLQVEFAVGSPKDLVEWESYHRLHQHESLFLPIEHHFENKFVCGQGGICRVTYPHYQYLLSDYIARFTGEDNLYEKEKMWYLTFQLCDAATAFHNRGEKLGDVRPINIFLNDFERVKVANRLSWPHQFTNYDKAMLDKETTYLAPQEIKELSFGHNQPETDFEKAESFSVGLTLLDRAVLTDSTDLYNFSTCRFDYQRLDERLAHLWEVAHLDSLLKQVIEGLCRPDPALRLTCRQVHAWLLPFSHDLLSKNEVSFSHLPPFLLPPQLTPPLSQLIPPPKNLYVQSQVVSEFTGRFPLEPLREIPARQAVSTVMPLPPPVHVGDGMDANEDFSLTLKRIEEQLQRSRKMFPS